MMIISDLLAVAMLIIVNLLIMIDMVTISSRSVPAGDNVKTASDRYIGDDIDFCPLGGGYEIDSLVCRQTKLAPPNFIASQECDGELLWWVSASLFFLLFC